VMFPKNKVVEETPASSVSPVSEVLVSVFIEEETDERKGNK